MANQPGAAAGVLRPVRHRHGRARHEGPHHTGSRMSSRVTCHKIEYCEAGEGCGRLVFICARQNFPRESFATFYFSAASVIKSKICASHKIFSPSEIFLSGSECRRGGVLSAAAK